eukprot:7150174-Prymnesium_polylepis.1
MRCGGARARACPGRRMTPIAAMQAIWRGVAWSAVARAEIAARWEHARLARTRNNARGPGIHRTHDDAREPSH